MPDTSPPPVAGHGAARLTSVVLDAYNAELRDKEGFLGDRASKRAFRAILDEWRDRLRKLGDEDPLGDEPSETVSKRRLEKLLADERPEVAALVLSVVEEFAQELAGVTRRFLKLKGWKDTQRIAVGGGMSGSRIGQLAIGRASLLLKADNQGVELRPITHEPDEAALIGAAHLAPSWIFAGHDSLLAVDIGGTNIRAGLVELNLKRAPDLSEARVVGIEVWRHRDDKPTREEAVERIALMLRGMTALAEAKKRALAPFIGVGCPGIIEEDGSIDRGGQNLPGNWESSRFNLPREIAAAVPEIGGHATTVLMHNDAVCQGLSEIPNMQDVERWGVLTIGTGLGNARFTNRRAD
ncbi:ROK family protein [Pararoseomonas indoligenes]|uniref:ROK family protein n=1 Tax=Roseomonas indoligenes TaxID=2820811 RepID=A0A940MW00_9PROT|nr:ROK family protein [Pararoseomonas indoligenes]MBP0491521.1 ROK family protein [Pararoseomonas indoligenes]